MFTRRALITLAILLYSASQVGAATFDRVRDAAPASPDAKAAQYLYISIQDGQPQGYARYTIPDLQLVETAPNQSDSNVDFGKGGQSYFVSTATGQQQSGLAIFDWPLGSGSQPGNEEAYGLCPTPNVQNALVSAIYKDLLYVIQNCPSGGFVAAYKLGKKARMEQPVATFVGGNFGPGLSFPSAIVVDHDGGLYVGDLGAGVTYFAPHSTTPVVAWPTGQGGSLNQLFVDSKNNVWATQNGAGSNYTFLNDSSCILSPSGTSVRNRVALIFNGGAQLQNGILYSLPADDPNFNSNATFLAVDSKGRAYIALYQQTGHVLDYDPGAACPDTNLTLNLPNNSTPDVAVDGKNRYYVSNSASGTISEYNAGSTTVQNVGNTPGGNVLTMDISPK
jgi:hypothetical protein